MRGEDEGVGAAAAGDGATAGDDDDDDDGGVVMPAKRGRKNKLREVCICGSYTINKMCVHMVCKVCCENMEGYCMAHAL